MSTHKHTFTHSCTHMCTHSHTPYTHTLARTQSHTGKAGCPAAGLLGREYTCTVVPVQHLSPEPRQPGITPASKPATRTASGDKRKSPEVGGGGGERRLLQTLRCRPDGSDPWLEEESLLHSGSWPLSPLVTPLPSHPPVRAWWVAAPPVPHMQPLEPEDFGSQLQLSPSLLCDPEPRAAPLCARHCHGG